MGFVSLPCSKSNFSKTKQAERTTSYNPIKEGVWKHLYVDDPLSTFGELTNCISGYNNLVDDVAYSLISHYSTVDNRNKEKIINLLASDSFIVLDA